MRNLHKTLIDLCAGLTLVGCAGIGLGGDHVRWTEEVKLSDGKVIQIQRHGELTESGFPAQKRGLDKYHEICYPPMNIHWKSRAAICRTSSISSMARPICTFPYPPLRSAMSKEAQTLVLCISFGTKGSGNESLTKSSPPGPNGIYCSRLAAVRPQLTLKA